MAPKHYPLPKTVDTRVHQYLSIPRDSMGQLSHHALRVAHHGKLDIYSDDIYDFDDRRFLGKGCFSTSSSQPITVDGVDYHTAEHYLQVMSCEDPQEATKLFFTRNPEAVKSMPRKINPEYAGARKELLRTVVCAKLTQHLDTAAELLATGNQYMASTGRDEYYGSGWRGQGHNILGETYMDERDRILRTILQKKTVHPIENPTPEQIDELAKEFQNQHPEAIANKVKEMTRKEMGDVMNMVYEEGPTKIVTPKSFNNRAIVGAIRSDSQYKSHKCNDGYEYLRPHQTLDSYHDTIHDKYQEVYNKKEANGEKMVHSMSDYRDTNPFFAPIDFLFRGVGPIPGPLPMAIISTVACFALLATGVGAGVIVGVAIGFSMISGAVQAYKSATENGLEGKKKILAVVLGAASGILTPPFPGVGCVMSALYVKGVEKGLKLGKGAMSVHFPKKENVLEDMPRNPGIEVLHERQRGVEVAAVTASAKAVPRAVQRSGNGDKKVVVDRPNATPPKVGGQRKYMSIQQK